MTESRSARDEKWLRSKINGLDGVIWWGWILTADPGPVDKRWDVRLQPLCAMKGYLELGADGRYEQVFELVSSSL